MQGMTHLLSYIQANHPSSPHAYSSTCPPQKAHLRAIPRRNPPSPKRQALQLDHSWLNKQHKRNHANQHTEDVSRVVSVVDDVAGATAVDAAILLWFESAREGGCHEGIFEGFCGGWGGRGNTGCFGEEVDETEDEVAGEGTAKIADAGDVNLY